MPSTIGTAVTGACVTRAARRSTALTLLALIGSATLSLTAGAQSAPEAKPSSYEFVISSGSLVPTGAQRATLKRGDLTVAQLSYVLNPGVALNASIGWARSHALATAGEPRLDVLTYDMGAEFRANQWMTRGAVTFSPFAGLGAGARSYHQRTVGLAATHNAAAYGSVGGEFGYKRVRMRLEARDYVTGFKQLTSGGAAGQRNDVALLLGFRITAH